MFTKATLYTTEFGFFDGNVQADIQDLDDLGVETTYDVLDRDLRQLKIVYPEYKPKDGIASICIDRMLQHLRDRKESYNFENGDRYRDYGAYTEFYRPDQDFGDEDDPHRLVRYAEKNTGDMEQDFRQVIKLIDAGKPEEAKAYAESCLYPKVRPIEEYGDPAE